MFAIYSNIQLKRLVLLALFILFGASHNAASNPTSNAGKKFFSANDEQGLITHSTENDENFYFKDASFPTQNYNRAPSVHYLFCSDRQTILQLTYKENIFEQLQKNKINFILTLFEEQCSIKEDQGYYLYMLQKLRL